MCKIDFTHDSGAFIADFEQANTSWADQAVVEKCSELSSWLLGRHEELIICHHKATWVGFEHWCCFKIFKTTCWIFSQGLIVCDLFFRVTNDKMNTKKLENENARYSQICELQNYIWLWNVDDTSALEVLGHFFMLKTILEKWLSLVQTKF